MNTRDRSKFHIRELSFCGNSGSGKTTLIEKLVERFSTAGMRVGYAKSDAHSFQMDTPGKDTHRQWLAGAGSVHIADREHAAFIQRGDTSPILQRANFAFADFVLVEGHRKSAMKKMVVLDAELQILKMVDSGEIENILALVGENQPEGYERYPFFHRDDVDGIGNFVLKQWQQQIDATQLYGLILSGGHSKRMKTDKAMLNISGKSQLEFAYDLLTPHCNSVFVSKRSDQKRAGPWSTIDDRMIEFGPIGGILSAQLEHPGAAFLVVACDLPFLDDATIGELIEQRNPYKMATCFDSSHNGLPEPLCAIYEPRAKFQMFQFVGAGMQCPRKVLLNSPVKRIEQINKRSLDNMNFPDELDKFRIDFQQTMLAANQPGDANINSEVKLGTE